MPAPLRIVPAVPAALGSSYTELALAALDEARADVLKAEAAGQPCTHMVICMIAEFQKNNQERMITQWVTSGISDLAALGVLDMVSHDMKGSS